MHNHFKPHGRTLLDFSVGMAAQVSPRRGPRTAYGVQRARVIGCVNYRGPNGSLQQVPPGVCRVEPQADGYRLTWTVDRVDVSVVVDPDTYGEHLVRKQIRLL